MSEPCRGEECGFTSESMKPCPWGRKGLGEVGTPAFLLIRVLGFSPPLHALQNGWPWENLQRSVFAYVVTFLTLFSTMKYLVHSTLDPTELEWDPKF